MKILKIIFILLNYINLYASFKSYELIGSKAIGMCGAFTAVADDTTAILYNPAALAQQNKNLIYFDYSNIFGIKDLNQFSILSKVNSIIGTIGLGFVNLNFKNYYKEQLWIISYAHLIFQKFRIGINLKYFDREIEGDFGELPTYKFSQKIGIDFGTLFQISDFLKIGIVTFNLNKPEILKEEGIAPTKFGFKLLPLILLDKYVNLNKNILDKFILTSDFFKSYYKNLISTGLEYIVNNYWSVYIGTDWKEKFTFGTTISIESINFGYSFVYNPSILNNNNLVSIELKL
jgi:hypothetical protein